MIKYLLLILLVGCSTRDMNWEAERRSCSDNDLVRVKTYTELCKANEYIETYCFDRAIVSICSIRDSI
jgi:hypothetical protein